MSDPPRSALPARFGRALSLARMCFGVLTLVAIVAQYTHRDHPTGFYTVNYFSFFTNQSNLLAAGLLLFGAWVGLRRGSGTVEPPGNEQRGDYSTYDLLRGAAVVYMTITGVVFSLLLSRSPQALPWANAVVHYVMPIVIVLDWLVDPPRIGLTRARAARWLIFPALYFAYTLIRGVIVDWYPYPFLNVDVHGYWGVLANGVGVLVGISAVSAAALLAGNQLGARRNVG